MKRLRKKGIGKDEFFKKIAINARVTDLDLVRDVFYGMIKTISRELKDKHVVALPDWGEFVLKIKPAQKNFVSARGVRGSLPAKVVLKFVADIKVRKHFHALGEEGTMIK